MRFGSRWQRVQTYAALGAWSAVALDDDDLNWKDTPESLILAMQLGLIWSPQIAVAIGMSATPLNIVEGAALTGLVASYAIGGREGAETYVDYITDPVDMVQNPEKAESLMMANRILQGVVTLGGSEVGRAGVKVILNYSDEIFKNRWLTGPYLPS
jgi:hypothetical protein